jgi:hypothetical protein
VHDAILFERLGVPAAAIVTEPFVPTAQAMARVEGAAGYPFVAVAHPVAGIDDAELARRVATAVDQVERLLLGRT